MGSKPWYYKGLRFECQRCGACCTSHDAYSYVYLRESEARAIARHLGRDWEEFREAEIGVQEDGLWHLRNVAARCPFLGDGALCAVYPVRPMQCRSWPFWRENLERAVWEGEVRKTCPGIGQGPRHEAAEIERIATENEAWYEDEDPAPEGDPAP